MTYIPSRSFEWAVSAPSVSRNGRSSGSMMLTTGWPPWLSRLPIKWERYWTSPLPQSFILPILGQFFGPQKLWPIVSGGPSEWMRT